MTATEEKPLVADAAIKAKLWIAPWSHSPLKRLAFVDAQLPQPQSVNVTRVAFILGPDVNTEEAARLMAESRFVLSYANGSLRAEWSGTQLASAGGVALDPPIMLGIGEEFHGEWIYTGSDARDNGYTQRVDGEWVMFGCLFTIDVIGAENPENPSKPWGDDNPLVSTRLNRAGAAK